MPYVQNHTDVIDIQIPTCFLLHTEVHYSLMIPTRGQDFMASKYGLEAINGHRNLHRCTENIHRKRGVSLVRELKDSISNKKQRKQKEQEPLNIGEVQRQLHSMVESLYTFNFVNKTSAEFNRMYKQHDIKSTYIVFPEKPNNSTRNAVFKHLTHRVPVFVQGHHVWDAVNSDAYANLKRQDVPYRHQSLEMPPLKGHRYGVFGPVQVMYKGKILPAKSLWILHIWGVDMEANRPTNQEMVHMNNMKNISERSDYVKDVMLANAMILKRAVCNAFPDQCTLHVHVAGVGTGVYMNMVDRIMRGDMKAILRKYYYDLNMQKLKEAVQCRGKQCPLYVSVPQWDLQDKSETIVYRLYLDSKYDQVVEKMLGTFNNADPLPMLACKWIHKSEQLSDQRLVSVGLNAWDSRSYIGNFVSQDDTLDGWMVAGVRNFKRQFADMPNTSYMHNAAVLYPTHMPVI